MEQAGPLQASTLPISMKHTESTGLKKKKKKSPIDEILYPLRLHQSLFDWFDTQFF